MNQTIAIHRETEGRCLKSISISVFMGYDNLGIPKFDHITFQEGVYYKMLHVHYGSVSGKYCWVYYPDGRKALLNVNLFSISEY